MRRRPQLGYRLGVTDSGSVIRILTLSLGALATIGCSDIADDFAVQTESALEAASAEAGEDLPVFTGDPTAMCQGVKFIGKNRLIQEGSRLCNRASDNQDLSSLSPANIRSGVTIAGTVGTMLPAPPVCSHAGEQNCVAAGNFYGGAPCPTSGSSGCYLPHYAFVTQPLMALDYDSVDTRNLRVSASIAGKSGGLEDCTFEGASSCVVTGAYRAADTTKINGGVIKKGVTVAGVLGLYPSVDHPLAGADSTTDLPPFASVSGGATYQWFQADGTRLTGTIQANQTVSSTTATQTLNAGLYRSVTVTGDANLTAGNIRSNTTILGVAGNYGTTCATDGAQDCIVSSSSTFKAANVSGITTWDIRAGKTVAAISGSLVFYKNMVGGFNRISGTGAAAGADIYDTIDDYNYYNASIFPQTNPWGGVTVAPGSNWTTVTGPCDGSGICVLRDETTGLLWAKADTTQRPWESAISHCAGLNYGGYSSGWRLPSQKELMQAYVDGIWTNQTKLSLLTSYYWSSSTLSPSTSHAWIVIPSYGYTYNVDKTVTYYVLCVR